MKFNYKAVLADIIGCTGDSGRLVLKSLLQEDYGCNTTIDLLHRDFKEMK